ncbi:MAG: glycerol-3-phosphate acyltransferase [Lachnospiraceae bacterium]|nr:glycerol-3-phosphate acyltransferase [Lachnospiraceae bacterium]
MMDIIYVRLIVIISICGFFLGSILFSKILPRAICGIDIVEVSEDGNPGVSNVFKYCSVPVGILTALCDFGKAFAPVLAADILIPMEVRTPLFGLVICSGVLGHIFSIFNHGNGGMGVAPFWATLMGVFLQCQLIFALVIIYVFIRYVFRVHAQHLRTILCFGIFFAFIMAFSTNMVYKPAYLILCAVICLKCLYIAVKQKRLPEQDTVEQQSGAGGNSINT